MYNSITPVCFTSPLIEKPIGKVRMNPFLVEQYDFSLLAVISFCLQLFGRHNQVDLIKVAGKIQFWAIRLALVALALYKMLGRENVDLRFPYLCFCFHIHSDDVLPTSLIVLVSQVFDLTPPVCQNLLEGKRVLLVIYIVGEGKAIFLYSLRFSAWGNAN